MNDVLDRTLDALANPHRRDIVDRLVAGPLDTPSLGTAFDMSKQALHRHLTVLEGAGLVERRAQGRVHEVRLCAEPLAAVVSWASEVRRGWETSLDRLAHVLEEAP